MEQQLILEKISKRYDDDIILENLNLEIYKNEFLTLLGPSGCGKTTTLRIIGGFTNPDSGKVLFEGQDITDLEPYRRNVNTVFQKYALFPNLNVFDNVAFGLRLKKVEKKEMKRQVHEMLHLVKMEHLSKRSIHELSGGQQQRIAIARALVNKPKVLLLDEPLGALDLKLRKRMQNELKNIQENLGLTFVYVTHDQEEALTMSDRIIIMENGKIQQTGTPEDIYNEPVNRFVANFIGESDIFEGEYLGDYHVRFLDHTFTCVDYFDKGEKVDVVIRPEDIEIYVGREDTVEAVVQSVRFKGVHYEILLKTKEQLYIAHTTKYFQENQSVGIRIIPDNIHLMKREADEI